MEKLKEEKYCSCITKRNHYVQQALQKEFLEDGKIYLLNKNKKEIKTLISKESLKNIFIKNKLYPKIKLKNLENSIILKNLGGINSIFIHRDRCIECNLGSLEKNFLDIINEKIKNEYKPKENIIRIHENLNSEDLESIKQYFYIQFGRTPVAINHFSENEKIKNLSDPIIKEFIDSGNSAIIKLISNDGKKIFYSILQNLNLKIIINQTNIPFILGGEGLFWTGKVNNKNSFEDLQIFLPIHPKILLLFEKGNSETKINRDKEDTHEINKYNLKNSESTSFISGDKEYLEKLRKEI